MNLHASRGSSLYDLDIKALKDHRLGACATNGDPQYRYLAV